MKLHCFICATVVFPDDPEAELKHHAYFLHAQVAAFQKTGVPVTLIQRVDVGLAYLAAFGVGVTAGMMVYAVVAALAMRQAAARSLAWGRRIAGVVGVAGIGVGFCWVWWAVG